MILNSYSPNYPKILKNQIAECLIVSKIKFHGYIDSKGVVFKKVINNSEDLRIHWSDITNCTYNHKIVKIFCDNLEYVVRFKDKTLANVYHVNLTKNMCGIEEDGWG